MVARVERTAVQAGRTSPVVTDTIRADTTPADTAAPERPVAGRSPGRQPGRERRAGEQTADTRPYHCHCQYWDWDWATLVARSPAAMAKQAGTTAPPARRARARFRVRPSPVRPSPVSTGTCSTFQCFVNTVSSIRIWETWHNRRRRERRASGHWMPDPPPLMFRSRMLAHCIPRILQCAHSMKGVALTRIATKGE